MRLRCNLCVAQKRDEASHKTDILWLRTISGRDYLVCRYHKGGSNYANSKRNLYRISKESPTSC